MEKIIFDFEGVKVDVDSSMSLTMLVAGNDFRFSYKDELYVVEEKTVFGIEQQSFNDKKKQELMKIPNYNGDYPKDAVELYVKMKKV